MPSWQALHRRRPEDEDGQDRCRDRCGGRNGKAFVARFLANDDTVIASDTSEEALQKLQAELGHERLHVKRGDISDERDTQALADLAQEAGGRVDVLVNAAGWFPIQPFEEVTADDFRKVVDINLTGTFLVIKAIYPLMKNGWGRIINFGSGSTFVGVATQAHYVAAKAGVTGLTRSIARALGGENITVNVITPGLTVTPVVKRTFPSELLDASVKARAIQREEIAEDLVGAVFFLASPDADFISGQTINVDGGAFMI